MVHHDEAGISDTHAHDELKRKISFKDSLVGDSREDTPLEADHWIDEQVTDHQDLRFYDLFILGFSFVSSFMVAFFIFLRCTVCN